MDNAERIAKLREVVDQSLTDLQGLANLLNEGTTEHQIVIQIAIQLDSAMIVTDVEEAK